MAQSPIRPTDDDARALARDLLSSATFAALGTLTPDDAVPMVTRVALATEPDGAPISLISDLSAHAVALAANPACSLMVGEPGTRGDPLTHPRLTLQCTATPLRHGETGHAECMARYLAQRPKAKLYAGFADFHLVRFDIRLGLLNGGFGKAFHLAATDILTAPDR